FFFQAEDGIRDATVTGVQTCALPICLPLRINREDTSGWYSSRRVAEDCSGFKVLIEEGKDRILGAHVLGPHADELINVFALAMQTETPARKLRHALFGYPTSGSDVKYML